MVSARLSRFPHLSWVQFGIEGVDTPRQMVVALNGFCHTLGLVRRGQHNVRWITRGTEKRWTSSTGSVHFLPCDDTHHTFVTNHSPDFLFNTLVLPRGHVSALLMSEQHEPRAELHRLLRPTDVVLQDCITRVVDACRQGHGDVDVRADEAARSLVLRLTELCGWGKPDWHDDASMLDRRTLHALVHRIDEHLRIGPSLGDMALVVGLSPSHSAKTFRQTTGLSLDRFINRRRVKRSLDTLKDHTHSVASISLDLGFSSQSHFSRVFRDVTGMTPAKYRKQFRRTVG